MNRSLMTALLIATSVFCGFTVVSGSDPFRSEDVPWTMNILTIDSDPSFYVGETLEVRLDLSSGCQALKLNISDTVDELASFETELGRRPYGNDSFTRGLWRLDSAISDKVKDESAFNNTGGMHKATIAPSPFHEGIDLPGIGSYIDVTSSDSLNITGTALSLEMWVNLSNSTTFRKMTLLDKESSYQIEMQANRELSWYLYTTSQAWYMIDTNYQLPIENWTYVAFTYDGAFGRTYVNGEEVHNASYAKGSVKVSNLPLGIGGGRKSGTWTNLFAGMIDEVRISNVTRTPDEINSSFTNYTLGGSHIFSYQLDVGHDTGVYWVRSETAEGRVLPTVYVDVLEARLGDPTDLRSRYGDGFVELAWGPPIEEPSIPHLGYRVYRSEGGLEPQMIWENSSEVLSFNDTGLDNGVRYSYIVKSFNSIRETPGLVLTEIPRTVPQAPSGLRAIPGDGTVVLTWNLSSYDGGSEIMGQAVNRWDRDSGTNTTFDLDAGSDSFTDEGAINGYLYIYTVRAVNGEGESPPSNEVPTVPMTFPDIPTNLKAIPGDRQIELLWEPPNNNGGSILMGYNVYRKHEDEPFKLLVMSPGNSHIDRGLINGDRYNYFVRALNDVGESGQCNEVSAVPMRIPSQPLAVALDRGNGYLNLTWSPPLDDGGSRINVYKVIRRTLDDGSERSVEMPGSSRYHNDTSVERGKTYEYSIIARNSIGASSVSTSVRAKALVLPTEPADLVMGRGDGFVLLMWTQPMDRGGDPNISYRIYRAVGDGEAVLIADLFGGLMSYNDTGLTNGVEYRFELSSINLLGESTLRKVGRMAPGTVPDIVKALKVIPGPGSVIITWDMPAQDGGLPVMGYRIYRSEGGGAFHRIGEVGVETMRFNDSYVLPGNSYIYMVRAFNDVGEGKEPRPVGHTFPPSEVSSESNLPLSMSAAVFVLGLGLGTVVMFLLMRRRRSGKGENLPPPEPSFVSEEPMVVDQAALHGLLKKIRDLGIPLIEVLRLDAERESSSRQADLRGASASKRRAQ